MKKQKKNAQAWLKAAAQKAAMEWNKLHAKQPTAKLFVFAQPGVIKVGPFDPDSLTASIQLSPSGTIEEKAKFIFGICRFTRCLPDGSSLW